MTRPCWFIGLSLLVGCLISAWLPMNMLLVVAIGSLLILCICVAVPLLRHRHRLLLSLMGFCAALISFAVTQLGQYLPLENRVGETVTLSARAEESDGGVYLTVIDGELPCGTRLQVWNWRDVWEIRPYDELQGTFVLHDYGESGFALLHRKAGGVWFAVTPETLHITGTNRPWTAVFSQLREKALNRINTYLSGDIAALTAGICFGADQSLSATAATNFRVCGISHLLSVSGFHMALLSQALLWLLERCRVSRIGRALITGAVLVAFGCLVGTEPSVIRSETLCILVLASGCFRRQADTRNSLGLALIVLLIAAPFAAYDVGLLLSFFATFGLVILCPRLVAWCKPLFDTAFLQRHSHLCRWMKMVLHAAALTVSATVATLPVSLLYFGEVPLLSVLANLLVSLPSSVLLITGLLGCLCFGAVLGPICALLFFCAGAISQYILWICEKISNFPLVTVAISTPYLLLWIIGMMGLLWLGWHVSRKSGLRLTAAIGTLTLLLAMIANTVVMNGVSTITAVPTNGDTAVYVQHEGKTLLVCTPQRTDTVFEIRAAFRLDGIKQVDVLVLPRGDTAVVLMMLTLLDEYLTHTTFLCGEETKWIGEHVKIVQPLSENGEVLWNDVLLRQHGTHTQISVNQTDVLLLGDDSSVRAVATSVWTSDLMIYADGIPDDALLLKGQYGVVQGHPYTLPSAAMCGVERLLTVTQNRMVFFTRGTGDIFCR